MTTEDRLRAAMRAHAESIEPAPDGWTRIQERLHTMPSRRARFLVVPAAAATVAAVLIGVSLLGDDDPTAPPVAEPTSTTTTAPPPSTTTTTAPAARYPANAVWPAQDSPRRFATPPELARAFARDFLGMKSPVVKTFRQNEPRAGEIDIHPNPRASIRTILTVQENDSGWFVTSANSPSIELDVPAADAAVTSPMKLSGRSVAYEGQVQMTLLEEGEPRFGTTLGSGYFTGNGDVKGPFTASLKFTSPRTPTGLLVLWTSSAEDGGLMEATIRRVRFGGHERPPS